MRVTDALSQIDAIHDQLAKGEVYRGFHVPGVAFAGLVGLLAAVLQPWMIAPDDADGFVHYWLAVAALSSLLAAGAALHTYWFHDDVFARRRARRVAGQFGPCLLAGAAATVAMLRGGPAYVPFLPGLWASFFGLGIFAIRPYLPRAIGWVGLFYLAAGAVLVVQAASVPRLSGWDVGAVFGIGHLATALVFHRNLERTEHE